MRLTGERGDGLRRLRRGSAVLIVWAAVGSSSAAPESFPVQRPANRIQAVTALSGGARIPCLTPLLETLRLDPRSATPAARRALAALQTDAALPSEIRDLSADGSVIRYTVDRASLDRIDAADGDLDGKPDAVSATAAALAEARRALVAENDFPDPGPVEVVLGRVGAGLDAILIPSGGRDGRPLIVADASSGRPIAALRRAVEHQYAHAVALAMGPSVSPGWGEALAAWTTLRLRPDDERVLTAVAARIARPQVGLGSDDLEIAEGNAAWLEFLHEAYGPTALRLSFDEMAKGAPLSAALDRALRRAVGVRLEDALRDYQLWSVLTGERDDHRHFTFASRLPSPSFASTSEGLPALSVQADPAVAPMGGTVALVRPDDGRGGMTVRFEGDPTGRWESDLLILRTDGGKQRVPIGLDAEGKGQVSVPLEGTREALLLVRNVDGDDRGPRRFSWSASREAGWPVEFSSVTASVEPSGVLVAWETRSESAVLGFNVLRQSAGGAAPVKVNPVWVPAVGEAASPASYRFFDAEATPGLAYAYRIEAITPDGLVSRSDPATPEPPAD